MAIFDIKTPKQFLYSIRCRYDTYRRPVVNGGRTTEDILYVIMGLYHLREWIARKEDKKYLPSCTEEARRFSDDLNGNSHYRKLRNVTNGTKHLKVSETVTSTVGGTTVDEWPNFDTVIDTDSGPPSEHFIDEVPVHVVIDSIIAKYQNWFDSIDSA